MHPRQGIASNLLQLVLHRTRELECRAIYLHVVDYNTAAIAFYERNGFWGASLLKGFYTIKCACVVNCYCFAHLISPAPLPARACLAGPQVQPC